MVPVPKMRRTRDRLADADDDVARGGVKEGRRERDGERRSSELAFRHENNESNVDVVERKQEKNCIHSAATCSLLALK